MLIKVMNEYQVAHFSMAHGVLLLKMSGL